MAASVSDQAYVFLWTVFSGVIIGVLYDIFRISRVFIRKIDLLVYFEDILYWVLVSVILFYVLYLTNGGEIRAYVFVGCFLGAAIYFLTFSRVIVNGIVLLIRWIGKVLSVILHFLSLPVVLLSRCLARPLKWVLKYCLYLSSRFRYFIYDKTRASKSGLRRFNRNRKKF